MANAAFMVQVNYWMNSYYYPTSTNKGLKMGSIERPTETVWMAETGGPVDSPGDGSNLCYPSYYGAVSNRTHGAYGFDTPNAYARLTDRHFGGTNVLWADGHVKWMRTSILESDSVNPTLGSAQTNSKYWWGR